MSDNTDIWLLHWGEPVIEIKPCFPDPDAIDSRQWTGLAARYGWSEQIKDEGGLRWVLARWLAGKCYALAHWLEDVA